MPDTHVPETNNSIQDSTDIEKLKLQLKFQEDKMSHEQKLLRTGLEHGAKSVFGAFITFGSLFLLNFGSYIIWDKSYMKSVEILWFAITMCATLIVYFSFIFGYIIYVSADIKSRKIDFSSRKNEKDSSQ